MPAKSSKPKNPKSADKSADFFRLSFESHPLPMWVYDLKTLAFLEVNEAAVEKYGYARAKFLKMTLKDIRPEEDVSHLLADAKKKRPALQHSGEWRHKLKDGRIIDVEVHSHEIEFNGRQAALVTAQDITERKQAEQARQKAELRYRSLFEQTHDAVFILDLKGRHLAANQRAADMLGYTLDEIMKLSFRETSAQIPESRKVLKRLLSGERIPLYERIFRKKDGSLVPAEVNVELVRDADGRPLHIQSVIRDITKRKQAEDEIRRMAERWSIVYHADGETSASLDIEQVFQATYRAVGQVMPCEDFLISLYDETRNLMWGHYILEDGKRVALNPYQADHGLGGYIVHSGRSVLLNSPEQINTSGIKFVPYGNGPITSSVLAVPMQIKGKTIGILSAQSYQSDAYTTEDRELLEMLASHVAIAIENARLFEQSQQEITERKRAEASLRENRDLLLALNRAAQSVQRARTPEQVYRAVGEQVKGLGLDATVLTFNDENKCLVVNYATFAAKIIRAGEKLMGLSLRDYRLPVPPESVYGRMMAAEKAEFVQWTGDLVGEALPKALRPLAGQLGRVLKIDRGIIAPLRVDETTMGLLTISGSGLNRENAPAVEAFAAQVAVSLQNVRLAQQAQEELAARRQAAETIANNEKRLRALIENGRDHISLLAADGMLLWESPATTHALGYALNQFVGRNIFELMHPDDQAWTRELFGQVAQTPGLSRDGIFRLRHSAGDWRWIEATATNLLEDPSVGAIVVNYRDITGRIQAEEQLVENEEKYRSLVESSESIITIVDSEGIHRFLNRAAATALGGTPQSLTGKPMSEFFPPQVAESQMANIRRVIASGEGIVTDSFSIVRGEPRWYRASIQPIRGADGRVKFALVNALDITERKQAEQALQESQQSYQKLVEQIPGVIYRDALDEKATTLFISPQIKDLTGYAPEEWLADPDLWLNLLHPDDRARVLAENKHHLATGAPFKSDYRLLARDGRMVWVRDEAVTICDSSGHPLYDQGVFTDITARKQAEEAIYEGQQVFRTLVENSPDIIARYDCDCRRTYVNPTYLKTAQMPQQKLLATSPIQYSPLPAASAVVLQNLLRKVLDSGVAEAVDVIWPKADNIDYWYNVYAAPEFDREGQIVSVMTVSRDITERKQAEEEIRQLNAELEQRVESRTHELRDAQEKLVRQEKLAVMGQLAGGVGHELRNPLAIINNAVYYLKLVQPDAEGKVKDYLGLIERETHNAEKIITDLLDFARIKSVEREAVSVSELVRQTLERYPAPPAVEVILDLPPDLPQVFADPRQMMQALGNLTINACQAMPKGGQLSVISKQLSVNSENWILIAVRDTGVGIPPENMKRLFEPLFTTKPKGIGLGLAVSRKLAEANGGRIEVQSEAGVGSTFTLYLPIHVG